MINSPRRPLQSLLPPLLLLVVLFVAAGVAHAKVQSGKVHLSGVRTESTLVKFAVPSSSKVELDVNVTSYGMYVNEKDLRLRVYVDDEWPTVRREPLCREKVKNAFMTLSVVFEYRGRLPDDRAGARRGDVVEMYGARIVATMNNPPPPRPGRDGKPPSPRSDRPRYYYFVMDDCSLEERYNDDKVPDVYYSAMVRNARRGGGGEGGDMQTTRVRPTSISRPTRMEYARCCS
jgi:hypothetical protein